MTTTTTTEYGFRTTPKTYRYGEGPVLNWPDASGFVTPRSSGQRSISPDLNVTDGDLARMHAAAEAFNTPSRASTTEVVSRQRIVTIGEPEVVPAPPKTDPALDGLAPGSIVRARKTGYGLGLFVLTADTDGIPWKGVEGDVLNIWSSTKNLRDVQRVHVVEA
jgi:hypothetical protein